MHGSNRLGGNSLSDLLVFGRRAGGAAADYANALQGTLTIDTQAVEEAAREMLALFERPDGENPYAIHADLQETMQNLVGIIRVEDELQKALQEIEVYRERAGRMSVTGNRQFNPGWHLAMDLASMLTVSEAVTRAAIERKESRGGHTREDHPATDPEFGKVNVVVRRADGPLTITKEPLPQMPEELRRIFEEAS
jgi:succinate dehydrogenase / fumarate reductase flavoprotein subunit